MRGDHAGAAGRFFTACFNEFIDSTNSTACRDKTGAKEALCADFFVRAEALTFHQRARRAVPFCRS